MLRMIQEGPPIDRLLADLGDAFDVEPGQDVARDVDEFLSCLREQGLVR
jgi:hypothetical protein